MILEEFFNKINLVFDKYRSSVLKRIALVEEFTDLERDFIGKFLSPRQNNDWFNIHCKISSNGTGVNRNWTISSDSSVIISSYPFKDHLRKELYYLIENKSSPVKRKLEERSFESKKIKTTNFKEEVTTYVENIIADDLIHPSTNSKLLTILEVVREVCLKNNLSESIINQTLGEYSLNPREIVSDIKEIISNSLIERNKKYTQNSLSPKTRDNRILSMQQSLKTEKKNLVICYANKVILTNALIDDCDRYEYCENGVMKDYSNLTSHVKKSIRIKITSCLSFIECIIKKSLLKIDYITNKLQEIEVNKSNSKYHLIDKTLEEFKIWNNEFKKNNSTNKLAVEVVQESSKMYKLSSTTILRWYNQYRVNGVASWFLFKRGKYKRKMRLSHIIINDQSIETLLKIFMKQEKNFNLDVCCKWIRKLLEDNFDDDSDERNIIINQSFVYRWIKLLGAKYDDIKKTYYTDNHEKEENVTYRTDVYIPLQDLLSLRQPVWVIIPYTEEESQRVALEDARRRTRLTVNETFMHEGRLCTKIHIDFLEENDYIDYRRELLKSTGSPGLYYYDEDPITKKLVIENNDCKFNHPKDKCRCHLKIRKTGQDEKCWHANKLTKKIWIINGVHKLPPKSAGAGIMTSCFVDSFTGFGIPLSNEELNTVNEFRRVNGREPLLSSSGVVFLNYGAHLEGYWCYENIEKQVIDIMDIYESLYNDYQIVFEVDHSKNHLKYAEDAQKFTYDEASGGPFGSNLPKEEWLNQPKEMKQILIERGLYTPNMNFRRDMEGILESLPDFKNEKCALQNLIESRGHILVISPKCHPELAGSGIEYAWGMAQNYFEKLGDKNSKNIKEKVKEAMSDKCLTIERVWKYERKARSYMQLYLQLKSNPDAGKLGYEERENLRIQLKMSRLHRNISKIEKYYISSS